MPSPKFSFAATDLIEQRKEQLEEFLDVVFAPEERPWFISDEASLSDIHAGDVSEVIDSCASHYKVTLKPTDLSKSVWQILDYLELNRPSVKR